MLLYHPAFDIHHGAFRVLQLLAVLPQKPYDVERIRILDFFLLFPEQIKTVRFPEEARKQKSFFKGLANRFEDIKDPKRIFFKIEGYQRTALQVLVLNELISSSQLKGDMVERTEKTLPAALAEAVDAANAKASQTLELLTGTFSRVDLYGNSGLKYRTHLFEYRYDLA